VPISRRRDFKEKKTTPCGGRGPGGRREAVSPRTIAPIMENRDAMKKKTQGRRIHEKEEETPG